jgi:hypothetical protein
MHSNFQMTAYPGDRGGADRSGITRALRGQSFLGAQPYLFMGRIMAARIKTFIANRWSLQYRTHTEIHFFCELSLAFETNHSHSQGSMNTMWRSQ